MSKSFTLSALNSFKSVGSVAPSSKYLVNKILKSIDFEQDLVIVEFGSGKGAFTKPLISKLSKNSHLICFELNEDFFNHISELDVGKSQVNFILDSAFNFEKHLQDLGIDSVDYFISSLPLALFSSGKKSAWLAQCNHWLKPFGCLFQYQYSLNSYKLLKRFFANVDLSFTFINIPPAVVYQCTKEND